MSDLIRVLYIEDNRSHIELVKRMLERAGYDVQSTMLGMEGIERAVNESFDLILTDYHLPDMKGIEVVERLRATPETAELPIVMLTANNMAGDRRLSLDAGCDAYTTKPIIRQELLNVIEQALRCHRTKV